MYVKKQQQLNIALSDDKIEGEWRYSAVAVFVNIFTGALCSLWKKSKRIFWSKWGSSMQTELHAALCRDSGGWCLSTHTSVEYYGMALSVSMETATWDAVSSEINDNYSTCILVNFYLKTEHRVCFCADLGQNKQTRQACSNTQPRTHKACVTHCQCILLDRFGEAVQSGVVSEAEHYFTYIIFFVLVKKKEENCFGIEIRFSDFYSGREQAKGKQKCISLLVVSRSFPTDSWMKEEETFLLLVIQRGKLLFLSRPHLHILCFARIFLTLTEQECVVG